MNDSVQNKEDLIRLIVEEEQKAKERIEKRFIPAQPSARPFAEQRAFFRDATKTKLVRTGNRAAKTFSTHRDLAWKIMRNHPYRKDWRGDYEASKKNPKKVWVCGPTFEFLMEVSWEMYLKQFIPRWYYTNEDGEEMISYGKYKGYEYVEKVYFRNGDVLEFKSYMQNILTKMGRAIDVAVLDEMPPKLMVISEIVTRCFDRSGDMTMGFTPLNPDADIKNYLENHPKMATHSWPLLSNPLYGKDPEKYQRVLDEYKHLPDNEKNARLNGDWYYENTGEELIFEGIVPETVKDFEVPLYWRQMIVVDPASHVTGFAIFAEDPENKIWYCIRAGELYWKDKLATAEDIVREIDRYKPHENFKYVKKIYDNAEAWFRAHAGNTWYPCIEKNKQAQIMAMRDLLANKKLIFFQNAASKAIQQIYKYKQKEGKIVKKNDHVVDCIQYFAREIPKPLKESPTPPTSQEDVVSCHMENLKKKWASGGQEHTGGERNSARYALYARSIANRRIR